ncbi:SseB family protein [Streptomyces sp. NPDC059649]|uniref:SseB family protein n=1 Tax=Streptomyces sp. NPDC059649 TaxID=3346895 RepID=UPI0036B86BEB
MASRHSNPHPARRWPLSPSRSPSKSSGASRCDHPVQLCPRRSPGHRGSARPGRTAARRLRIRDRPVLRPQWRRPPVRHRRRLVRRLQRAVTGYGSEQELLAAFRDATLLLFTQEGQTGLYTVVEDDGSRYIPAFTHPTQTPDTWHQWQHTTGHHLAATGLPIRLNPGHRISLTIPGVFSSGADQRALTRCF